MNWILKIVAVCAAFVGIANAAPKIWDGTADVSWFGDTSAQQYNLTTAEQLAGLAKIVNEGVSTFKGKKITLGADIFLNDTAKTASGTWENKTRLQWIPIGLKPNSFKGEFDGLIGNRNAVIYGLYINDTTVNYAGLFGYVPDGKISNLDLRVGYIKAGYRVGALAGNTWYMSVYNVHSEIPVSGRGSVGGLVGVSDGRVYTSSVKGNVVGLDSVGGLVGSLGAVTGYGLSDSYFIGNVTGRKHVGGLVGNGRGILNCYADGSVKGDSNYVGGIVGWGSGKIDSVYHTGGDVSGYLYVGGVAGRFDGKLNFAYHVGGNVNGYSYVGGVVGDANSISSSKSLIVNSYAQCNVTGISDYVGGLAGVSDSVVNSYAKGNVKGASSVGGLVGQAKNIVDSSYFIGGEVHGDTNVGGLVGYAFETVMNSYSQCNVIGTGNYIGGLLGVAKTVMNSYSQSNVSGGGSYIGGLAGDAFYGISDSHSEGHVNATGQNAQYIGGLIGYANRFIRKSYSKSDVFSSGKYVGGVIGYSADSVEHVYALGSVTGLNYVGGLIGYAVGDEVRVSYYEGDSVSGTNYVGGLVGSMSVGSGSKKGVFTSYAKTKVKGSRFVGGLLGRGVNIGNSFAEGNVIGDSSYVGGVAGYAKGTVNSSYHINGDVYGQDTVGGLVGFAMELVSNSYTHGNLVKGRNVVGGLVGYAKNNVDSTYSMVNVQGDNQVGGLIGGANNMVSNSFAMGNVAGNSSADNGNIGGLVGYQYRGSVNKSMALGDVSGTTNLGGLVGRFDGEKITQSYAKGDVTGDAYMGGLVGYATGTLEETYASGVVQGKESAYTGCMVGYAKGSLKINKSYYDKTKCSLDVGGDKGNVSVSGTPGKTTVEMQIQETFEDWDFVDTWHIVEGVYPYLRNYSNLMDKAVVEIEPLENIIYDGAAKSPKVSSVTLFGNKLIPENDYTVTYKNNVNAGMASINICGLPQYHGCKVIEFEILGIEVDLKIAPIANMKYTGEPLTPQVIAYDDTTLIPTTDYVVEYKDNINAGTATVSVKMKGNYRGSATITFTIEKETLLITQNPKAGDLILGESLASSKLSGGEASVEGDFVWKSPTTIPRLDNDGFAVLFIPADTVNFSIPAEIVVPVKVLDLVYVAVHLGKNTLDSIAFAKGLSYTLPKVSDSTGYNFVGFFKGTTFAGKSGDKITISENTVIDAIYKINSFVVAFMMGSTELQSSELAYGTIPTAPMVELPQNTDKYTYNFRGWDKEIVAVTETVTYKAIVDSVLNKYKVVFKNYDGKVLKDSTYEYGTSAGKIAKPATPTRTEMAGYAYTFKDWNPKVADVTGDATYTAVFDSTVLKYTITFVNGTEKLQTEMMTYGSMPKYNGSAPTRKSTVGFTYTFKGWTPEIAEVTSSVTYKAVFDSAANKFRVVFKNYNGNIIRDSSYAYGTAANVIKPSNPTRQMTAKYSYTFKGWNPAVAAVTGEATYIAVFDSIVRKFIVTFKNGDQKLTSSSIAYGETPKYTGETPTKEPTKKYVYKFAGWSPKLEAVTKDITYQAVFDSVKNTGIIEGRLVRSGVSVRTVSRSVQISAAPVGVTYAIVDLQGRVMKKGRVESTNFNVSLLKAGVYMVRVGQRTWKVKME